MSSDEKRLRVMRDAAPELFEALEKMVAWANGGGATGGYPGSEVAAALAKARGEASA